jgi:glycosyltransferase involved in cell wall biosynthesis
MNELTLSFYNNGKPIKRGTILRSIADGLERRGFRITWGDDEVEPDVYIFEKFWSDTRYRKPVIIHAENLIGEAAHKHCYDRGDAIVFNSEWLRQVYRQSFGSELTSACVIPTGHQIQDRLPRTAPDVSQEQNIVCISKWWKRPYKRFPLIAHAFHHLNRELGYPNAKLHVLGWLTTEPMPYYDTGPRLWSLPRAVRENMNITFHQKGFHNDTYSNALSAAHVLVHLSSIDSGPQTVAEALSQGVPVVITNNMGAAEWVRAAGSKYGAVIDLDSITADADAIGRLIPNYWMWRWSWRFRRLCNQKRGYLEVAQAIKKILDTYPERVLEPYGPCTMEDICGRWIKVIRSVVQRGIGLAN